MSDPITLVNINGKIVDGNLAPKDRTFRNAWALDEENSIVIDMDKAITIQKENLRIDRKPILEGLDVEYQRADEKGDVEKKKEIIKIKEKLRNVTSDKRLEKAKTPEELENLTLEVLLDVPN